MIVILLWIIMMDTTDCLAALALVARHSRHNQINDRLRHAFVSTGPLATREPPSLCTRDNKWSDGVTQVPWMEEGSVPRLGC